MKLRYMNTLKKGFSMIELIIVIAVLGVLTAVVLNQAQGMRESSNLNRESSNLGMLTTAVQSTFNSQGNYNGALNEIIKSSTSFPSSMNDGKDPVNGGGNGNAGNSIKSVWDDKGVDILSANYNGQDFAGFMVIYRNVPNSSCMDFVSQNYSSFYGVSVADDLSPASNGSQTVSGLTTTVYSSDPADTTAYSVGTAQSACSGSDGKDIAFFSR